MMTNLLKIRVCSLVVYVSVILHTAAIEVNVALNKSTIQSGTLEWPEDSKQFWNAGTAVNGRHSCGNTTDAQQYSGTIELQNPWWQVDLGKVYNISKVLVYGKQNSKHNLQYDGFMLYSTLTNDTEGSVNQAEHLESSHGEYDEIQGPMLGRFITIKLPAILTKNNHPLILCEVEVYSEVCTDGRYGTGCTKTCGKCASGSTCNKANGTCPAGCQPGNFGAKCDRVCADGRYDTGCNKTCGKCALESTCNKANGTCPVGCQPGNFGAKCDRECSDGWYGNNCTRKCGHCAEGSTCNKTNGNCPVGCQPGNRGDKCDGECAYGTYGTNCIQQCGHCEVGTTCTKANGTCPKGCNPGYLGVKCDRECTDGWFGKNCTQQCGHCEVGTTCTKANGTCPKGCNPGYLGVKCDRECGHGTFGDNCTHQCHCYKDANCTNNQGICPDNMPLCAPGWQGMSCSQVCNEGTFGLNCAQHCHCFNDTNCSNVQGTCPDTKPRCSPGWWNPSCDRECYHGTFGLNCSERCHCFNNANCTNDLGTCPDVQTPCTFGWQGRSCDEEDLQQTEGSGVTVPAVMGVVGALVVTVVISVAVFIKRRQRLAKGRSGTKYASNKEVKLEESKLAPVHAEKPDNNLPDAQQNDVFKIETEEHEYYRFSLTKSEIKPCNLWFYIRKMQDDECKSFYEEFESLPHGLKLPYTAAMIPENRPKNRYREMYTYDHSRVVLNITGPDQTDYINASHIHGFERTKKFIASQGPTDKMTNDFWRMVWQQNVEIIVMLTNVMENGNKKCEKYWPDDDEVGAYGEVKVKVIRTDMLVDYYMRKMEVSMEGKPTRTVTQFHFRSWPDKDVPDSTWCLVNFWRAASGHPSGEAPIVVHCSAGIGRTGTYIALDYLYNQLQQEGSVRPFQAVHALRRQRVNMVQTREQYAYLHEAVADAICLGTHFILASQFQEYYDYMTQLQPGASKSPLKLQFELAVQSLRKNRVAGASVETFADETYANAIVAAEINAYRPQVKKRISNYIKEMGAMYLPIHSGAGGFLIAKSPTEKSLAEFWSLVHKQNVTAVISLCESTATNYRACANLGVDTGALDGMFQVTSLDATKFRSFEERTYVLKEHGKEDGSRATLKVFDYKAWKSGYNIPAEARSMFELLDAVTRWQPHISEAQPILVHCNNGTRRSGLVCLVLSELQRLKREDGQVNILDSLMQLKQRNMDVIENEGQYQYCFDVIRTYVQQSKEESVQVQKDQDQHIYTNM